MVFSRKTVLALLVLICFLPPSCSYPPRVRQSVSAPYVVRVSPLDIPVFIDTGDRESLRDAAEKDISALSRFDPDQSFLLGGMVVKALRLKATVQVFLHLLDEGLSRQAFQEELARRFDFYKIERTIEAVDKDPLLITGYFQPELSASLTPNDRFTYPLYGVPADLVRVDIRQFNPALPAVTIWGRVSGQRLVPYYPRKEIDSGRWPANAPVLAWLASPVDGLMLHIQGSGILRFEDGSRRFIHYAASNGLPYESVGGWLIGQGLIKRDQADWSHIRAWVEANPDRLEDALASNPRYIFFKWGKDGPVGSLGEVLTPLRSVALDPSVYPPGALCFLEFDARQALGSCVDRDFKGFVFNQDTGAAIKGPYRLDLYCGTGGRAGEVAGRLKAKGALYLMLLKTQE
ncbi:MAG: murein transglycosylase A [Dissulfurimicrobium sp.]|uniref:murein transglycosylase A n=1 Tax=Dissulfurimicrobium TaxID=1769732 RepID=UPI001EDB658F|nr:MltA domain-containing protein [Dissulfurimicrobium hydrothermale]UKL14232.1 MltA domain-containing protein [Dissulfurimicrobium hydrothermale]